MNKTIHKFPVELQDSFQITLPKNSHILCVKMQVEDPFIWVMIDKDEKETGIRHFSVIGTGNPFTLSDFTYIGTFQLYLGSLVFHLFENKS